MRGSWRLNTVVFGGRAHKFKSNYFNKLLTDCRDLKRRFNSRAKLVKWSFRCQRGAGEARLAVSVYDSERFMHF